MSDAIKVAVLGADGRMGQAVVAALSETPTAVLAAAITHSQSPHLGKDAIALAGAKGDAVPLTDDFSKANACDVGLDFSAPEAVLAFTKALKGQKLKALVSGTTGINKEQNKALQGNCEGLALLQSGNFSLGVNMLEALVALASSKLREGWDIDVLEMHHRHKVDAPSGTALMLGQAAASGRNVQLETVQKLSREGQTGARPEGEIGFATLRGGGVIGEHSVMIASELEMLTLSHSAFDRSVFAKGAVSAALWAVRQPAGHYDMKDLLGLN